MLAFAAKFMKGKDQDEEATRHLIEGLDGIYVRSYEFDKEGQYSMEEIQKPANISKPLNGRQSSARPAERAGEPPT
jgi:hypothetical protein